MDIEEAQLAKSGAGGRLAVDIGGTFTDVVLEREGRQTAIKVLTTPRAPEQGVLDGVGRILEQTGAEAGEIELLIHGTTLATNAIIERRGATTALVTTAGFRDVLEIANEGRYDQYDVMIEKPRPLVPRERRFAVPERMDVHGRVLLPLDEAAVAALVPALAAAGVASIAVGFMHSYANDEHERRAGAILADALPGCAITLSSAVCPELREYERFTTATANAYVQPLMASYLGRLGEGLRALGLVCPVLLMTSGGGLTTLESARRFPIRLVESGPAGGAILAAHIAREADMRRVLSFDMGGTTAKICLIENGEAETARSFEVDRATRHLKGSGLPLRVPVIEMVEIGAGGGSIARVDLLGQITVGPDSAGSEPGPACYARGGDQPTVTDADLLLGRIDPERFADGAFRPDAARAAEAIARVVGQPLSLSPPLAAFGITEIVDETMANAARVHAVERGFEVAEHTLVAFGGAAPLHAARMAEKLRMDRVLVPANAGVGSALGFLRAPIAYEVVKSRYMRLAAFDADGVNELFARLYEEAEQVVAPAAGRLPLQQVRLAYMRYVGQGHEIVVTLPIRDYRPADGGTIQAAYDELYRRQFARTIPDADVEVLTWSLVLSTPAPPAAAPGGDGRAPTARSGEASGDGKRRLFDTDTGEFIEVTVYRRERLAPGERCPGPCVITEEGTATWVTATFEACLQSSGHLLLERRRQTAA